MFQSHVFVLIPQLQNLQFTRTSLVRTRFKYQDQKFDINAWREKIIFMRWEKNEVTNIKKLDYTKYRLLINTLSQVSKVKLFLSSIRVQN